MKLNLNHKTYVEEDEELDRMKIQHFLLMKDRKMFYYAIKLVELQNQNPLMIILR